jgi:AraC-like DNA-binding protein
LWGGFYLTLSHAIYIAPAMQRLDLLLEHFQFRTKTAFHGKVCSDIQPLRDFQTGFIHFIRSGHAVIEVAGIKTIRTESPSLVFFPRASYHSIRAADGQEIDLVCATVSFRDPNNPLAISFPDILVVPIVVAPEMGATLDLLFGEFHRNELGRDTILDSATRILLLQLIRLQVYKGQLNGGLLSGLSCPHLSSVLSLMYERFAQELSVEQMAEKAGMSRSVFIQHFRKTIGITPYDYLIQLRINIAQTRLELGQSSIKKIATEVGYNSISAFARLFKQQVGMTPGQWRLHGMKSCKNTIGQ